jgi:hypothetical protein
MPADGEQIEAALEATTGWRFMVEELRAVGAEVHLAEPAETSALRGPKKRAKTDRQDARRLRELLQAGRVPKSWIPPEHMLELRSRVRLHADRRALRVAAAHPGAALPPRASSAGGTCSGPRAAAGWRRSSCPTPPTARSRTPCR